MGTNKTAAREHLRAAARIGEVQQMDQTDKTVHTAPAADVDDLIFDDPADWQISDR